MTAYISISTLVGSILNNLPEKNDPFYDDKLRSLLATVCLDMDAYRATSCDRGLELTYWRDWARSHDATNAMGDQELRDQLDARMERIRAALEGSVSAYKTLEENCALIDQRLNGAEARCGEIEQNFQKATALAELRVGWWSPHRTDPPEAWLGARREGIAESEDAYFPADQQRDHAIAAMGRMEEILAEVRDERDSWKQKALDLETDLQDAAEKSNDRLRQLHQAKSELQTARAQATVRSEALDKLENRYQQMRSRALKAESALLRGAVETADVPRPVEPSEAGEDWTDEGSFDDGDAETVVSERALEG